jgi:hypothetical protein
LEFKPAKRRRASNEGIYVDMKVFNIHKGVAKGDPAAQIQTGAKRVSEGAIVFRPGMDST